MANAALVQNSQRLIATAQKELLKDNAIKYKSDQNAAAKSAENRLTVLSIFAGNNVIWDPVSNAILQTEARAAIVENRVSRLNAARSSLVENNVQNYSTAETINAKGLVMRTSATPASSPYYLTINVAVERRRCFKYWAEAESLVWKKFLHVT